MRFEVHVEISGAALAEDETGIMELGRIVRELAAGIDNARLMEAGDEVTLFDYNGNTAGHARMVPDWTVGEEVYATTEAGSLVHSRIVSVDPSHIKLSQRFYRVVVAPLWSGQSMPAVYVDSHGFGVHGEPYLGRVR